MKKIILIIALLAMPLFAVVPSVQLVGLYMDDHGNPPITPTTGTLTGNDPMTLWFKVNTPSGYTNISRIAVTMWDDGAGSSFSDINSENHATFIYYCNTGDWSLLSGSYSWNLNKFYSSSVLNTNTSTNIQNFKLVFTPGKLAQTEVTTNWKIHICVSNNNNESSNIQRAYKLTPVTSAGSNQYGGGVLFASPNPLNLGLGQTIKFSYSKTFGTDCTLTLQVFTIYGDLVKTLAQDKAFTGDMTLGIEWDGKNGVGRQVASGIYTAVLGINYSGEHKEKQVFNFAVYK